MAGHMSVALVGTTGSGKTSLACSAADGPGTASTKAPCVPTVSVTKHAVEVPGMNGEPTVSINLWEAPIWHLIMDPKAHFRNGADAVVFIIDCTDRESLDEVLLRWLHVARYHSAPSAPFLFVGTKEDLAAPESLATVKERLVELRVPHLLGSCRKEGFGKEVLHELLKLRAEASSESGSARDTLPLFCALPALQVPVKAQAHDCGGGVATLLKGAVLPPQLTLGPAPPKAKSTTAAQAPPWQIAAGEVIPYRNTNGVVARLDGPDSGAGRGHGGRSPSTCAMWRGMTVVAKEVDKSLLLERCSSEKELLILLEELSNADCPDLAQFFGACLETSPVTLVMEYMPGGDLERYLRSRRHESHRPWVPPKDLFSRWAIGTARALAFLASRSPAIVHGNIRPSNLLLCTSLAIKLSTSGVLSPVAHRHKAAKGDQSLENCLYSAPEVMKGEGYTAAADIFALGLVLWFMCTGTRPLHNLDNDGGHAPPDHVMQAFAEGKAPMPDLSLVRQGPLRTLIKEALSDKALRPTPEELQRRLQELAESASRQTQCCCVT